jgi:hypothetical protein
MSADSLHSAKPLLEATMTHSIHQFIPRKVHALLDYVISGLIIASPWLFGFSAKPVAPKIAMIAGCAIATYSLFTSYELGLVRMFPFAIHLFFDMLIGILLAAAFIDLGEGGRVGVVFGILGLLILFNAFCAIRPKDIDTG